MGQAIAVRMDFTAEEVRRFAKRAKVAAQTRRLLAIAAVLDGAYREDAAKIGGMDRQTLRDWVFRFNERGPEGLVNIPSPGVPPQARQKASGLSGPAGRGRADPSCTWGCALARLRSDHAVTREVWTIGIGRYDLSGFEGVGLLACERSPQGLQTGSRRRGDVQKNFPARVAEVYRATSIRFRTTRS
jgi:Winged helix-turn helix